MTPAGSGERSQEQPGVALVTGAGGQLGRALMRELASRGREAVGLSHAELEITDGTRVSEVIAALTPATVFHCAAWTAVDDAEADRAGAFAANEAGTRAVAAAAAACDSRLVYVSTDYVFPGVSDVGWAEDDPTDPINIYGASKLAGEVATAAEHPSPLIARTAWLFGAEGTNFVRTILRLATSRDWIDVVDDQVGSPTFVPHLAAAMLVADDARLTGTIHLGGTPTATWFDVAEFAVREAGLACVVRRTTSDAYPRPAARPACSILRVTRTDTPQVGDWRDGVREVVASTIAAPH